MKYDPTKNFIGGFSDNDGTIDLYLRVNFLINHNFTILDFGTGRAAWFEDDDCVTRRSIRLLNDKWKGLSQRIWTRLFSTIKRALNKFL